MKITTAQTLRIALRAQVTPRTVKRRVEKKLTGKQSIDERIDAAANIELGSHATGGSTPPASMAG